jgi:hypothetical protein
VRRRIAALFGVELREAATSRKQHAVLVLVENAERHIPAHILAAPAQRRRRVGAAVSLGEPADDGRRAQDLARARALPEREVESTIRSSSIVTS